MAPLRGYNNVWMTANLGWRTYHGLQLSLQRRLNQGIQFGLNDTITLSDQGFCASGGCPSMQPLRMQHNADGTYVIRSDQGQQDDLLGDMLTPRHILKGTFLWMLPSMSSGALGALINDWQVAGVWTAATGQPYAVAYTYSSGGSNINLTGSPDYGARVRIVGDTGSGCSGDSLRQFRANAFQGPISPSVGLESGNGYLQGCFQSALDMSISKQIRLPGNKSVSFRADIFNFLNQAIVTGRNTSMQLASPNDPVTIVNLPVDASGQPDCRADEAERRRLRRREQLPGTAHRAAAAAVCFLDRSGRSGRSIRSGSFAWFLPFARSGRSERPERSERLNDPNDSNDRTIKRLERSERYFDSIRPIRRPSSFTP